MARAAVPDYLGNSFDESSPGLRFGLFLPVWTTRDDQEQEINDRASKRSRDAESLQNRIKREGIEAVISSFVADERLPGLWEKNDAASKKSWSTVQRFSASDQARLNALVIRQGALAASLPDSLTLCAKSTAPFTTGLGNEHPLENGFSFLNPYGLPYLPGSGVKGVIRQAVRELTCGEWGNTSGWSAQKFEREIDEKNKLSLSMVDLLLGLETDDREKEHFRGVLTFYDVIPDIAGNALMVEIMTPHQGHYYQQNPAAGSTNPHDSGGPVPISFLTVPPNSGFTFLVRCDEQRLNALAPDLVTDGKWKKLVESAFSHAFQWLGFGAKTAVGYGAMKADEEAGRRIERERLEQMEARVAQKEEQERLERRALMSEALKDVEEFCEYMAKREQELRGRKGRPGEAEHSCATALAKKALDPEKGWTAEEKLKAVEAIEKWLPKLVDVNMKDQRKKMQLNLLSGKT